jgi:drug/metabolite transporter (DMT)-like permease
VSFLDRYEPVRRYLYSLLAPLATVLVVYGFTSEETIATWIGLATAVLGIGTVEAARARVTPVPRDGT